MGTLLSFVGRVAIRVTGRGVDRGVRVAAVGLVTLVAALAAPSQPVRASMDVAGWAVAQDVGTVVRARSLRHVDAFAQAAADLPPHDPGVGTLAGEAGVDGGAAVYRVPIVVPPGRAGMQPALSLTYSSRGGDGVLGVGGSIGGLSSLHRCPGTPEQDGQGRGVDYSNADRLCLDGQRLVAVAGTYGKAGAEYRTEVDRFARITQTGGDLAGNTACFRVDERSGRVRHYGAVATGALSGPPNGCAGAGATTPVARVVPGGAPSALSWALVKEEDRVGNFQLYTYTDVGNGEVLLATVSYTGYCSAGGACTAGDRSVSFTYQPRTAAAAGATDIGSSYLAGGLTLQTQALAAVTTKVGATVVRQIVPAFTASAYSGRLLLASLTEKARNSGGTMDAHPATTFAFNHGAPTAALVALDGQGLPQPGAVADGTAAPLPYTVSLLADLDGDGTREAAIRMPQSGGDKVYLAQLTADRQLHAVVDMTGAPFSIAPRDYADLDSDGRAELVYANGATLAFGVWNLPRGAVTASNPFRTVTTTIPVAGVGGFADPHQTFAAADLDGDGRTDLLLVEATAACGSDAQGAKRGVFFYRNTTAPGVFGASASFAKQSGALVCLARSIVGLVTTEQQIDHLTDLDGDGVPDLVLSAHDSATNTSSIAGAVRLTRSGSTLASAGLADCAALHLSADECDGTQGYLTRWLDVNADGLEDFVIARPAQGVWKLHLNRGGTAWFGAEIDTGSGAGLIGYDSGSGTRFRYAHRLPAMDVDSDGKPDIMIVSPTKGFAAKLCAIRIVGPTGPNGSEGCPPQSNFTNSPAAQQCPAYACPEEPTSTTVNLPDNPIFTSGYPYAWNGVPAFGTYDYAAAHGAPGVDPSVYHLAALKFVQTGAAAFTVKVVETPYVSRLSEPGVTTATDDLFGDGLTDLATSVGCPNSSVTIGIQTFSACTAVNDGTHGPAFFDGRATATLATAPVLYVNENLGPDIGNSLALQQARTATLGRLAAAAAGPVLPDLLSVVTDGVGDTAWWGQVPLSTPGSQDGIPVYSVPAANGYADARHLYFTSTMPVVAGFAQSNGIGGVLGARSAIYGYSEAMYNTQGRGFQGFHTIVAETAADANSPSDYARRLRTTTTYHQKFPLTGQVAAVVTTRQNSASKVAETTATYRCATRTATDYPATLDRSTAALCPGDPAGSAVPAANTVYDVFADTTSDKAYDLGSGTLYAHTDTVNAASAGATTSGWDRYGNLVDQVVTVADDGVASDLASHITSTHNDITATPADWWLDQLTHTATTRSVSYAAGHALPAGASAPAQSLTTDLTWNADRTLASQTVQAGVTDQASTTTTTYPVPSYGLPVQVQTTLSGLAPALSPTRTSSFTYTKNGTTAAADGYFVLDSTADPAGLHQTTTTTWSPGLGAVLTKTDPNGLTLATTYDAFGRAIQQAVTDRFGVAVGSPVQAAWTRCPGQCAGLVAEDGNAANAAWRVTRVHAGYPTTVAWFDRLGRPIKQASAGFDGQFSATLTAYDALGTVAAQSTPYTVGASLPTFTSTDYDGLGRPTLKVLTGSSLDSTHGNQVRELAYSGRTTTVTVRAMTIALSGGNCPGGAGNLCFKLSHRTNALGALMHTMDAGNAATDYWPGANGPLVAHQDAQGNVATATIDALGRRTASSDPDQGSWTTRYDALGELLTQTDARGVLTTVTNRDALGRPTAQTLLPPASAVAGLSPQVFQDSWSYDPANGKGLLDTATRRRGLDRATPANNPVVWTQSTAYDTAARTSNVSTTISEGGATALGYAQSYDSHGRPDTVTYPSGLRVQTGYTAYGQTSALSNADTAAVYWSATAADAWGHVTADSAANGIAGSYAYDAFTGQALQRSWTQNNAPLESLAYAYDSFANLHTQTRQGNTETYAYDVRQRLTSATRTNGGVVSYAYTASGNLSSKSDYSTAVAGAYVYAAANSLTNGCGPHATNAVSLAGGGTATYTCDANGNVIGGSTLNATVAADNRPILLTRAATGGTPDPSCATAQGDRLFCSSFEPYVAGMGGGTAAWAYASDGSKVYESGTAGAIWFGPFGYEKVGTTHRHQLGPVVVARNGATDTITTILSDRLGSTVGTVDPATSVLRAFDPFGAVRNGDLTTKPDGTLALPATLHGFTQHEHADALRLIHMGGRVFDPALGRFLSVDPIIQNPANSQSLNPYSYIGNNPLSGVDPSGYEAEGNECPADAPGCQHVPDPRESITSKTADAEGWTSTSGLVGTPGSGDTHDRQMAKGATSAPPGSSVVTDASKIGSRWAATVADSQEDPTVGVMDLSRGEMLSGFLVTPNGFYTAWEWRNRRQLEQAWSDVDRQVRSEASQIVDRFGTRPLVGAAAGIGVAAAIGKVATTIGGVVRGAEIAGSSAEVVSGQGPHIVLGLRAFGLEETALRVGGKTLLENPAWRQALADAISNPAARFTISVEGLSGSSVYSKIVGAITRPGASATNWELAQLAQAGRLGNVNFVDRLGNILENPFGR